MLDEAMAGADEVLELWGTPLPELKPSCKLRLLRYR
jgi:hypothetical protein